MVDDTLAAIFIAADMAEPAACIRALVHVLVLDVRAHAHVQAAVERDAVGKWSTNARFAQELQTHMPAAKNNPCCLLQG